MPVLDNAVFHENVCNSATAASCVQRCNAAGKDLSFFKTTTRPDTATKKLWRDARLLTRLVVAGEDRFETTFTTERRMNSAKNLEQKQLNSKIPKITR